MIYGNTNGIKEVIVKQMQQWVDSYDRTLFVDRDLLAQMIAVSNTVNREICIFVSRGGRVLAVGVGNSDTVPLKELNQRRGNNRLNGVRCIHTHPNATARLSNADISALVASRYDCMCAIGIQNGRMTDMETAYLSADGVRRTYSRGGTIDDDALLAGIAQAERESQGTAVQADDPQRALLVHASTDADAEQSLDELARLAKTMDYEPVDRCLQKKATPDKATYIGSGKVQELAMACQVHRVGTVIFDHQLSGVQITNLRRLLGREVIDRTILILDIFAKHATTNEGKLQVELARLQHQLPLLSTAAEGYSRQRGGLHAMGGAGETKAETDRRAIRRQIDALREKLNKLQAQRDERRQTRGRSGLKNVVIVGYTNAGKSTLMNCLTKAGVLQEDKLFATLDSVSRTVWDNGDKYLLTDTVGFIKRLPHEFVEAFKSTLDEARYADLLLHVVDAGSKQLESEYKVVNDVLNQIGAHAPCLVVYNKCDKGVAEALPQLKDSVTISARTGEGIDTLRDEIRKRLFAKE